MPRRWTRKEETLFYNELYFLYVEKNKSIGEISGILQIASQTVFQRLKRLGIATSPERKRGYLHMRSDIKIPIRYTKELAEFFGIMLGDGSLSHFQVMVTLGAKEGAYTEYVCSLMEKVFKAKPKIVIRKKGYKDVYLGSVKLSSWLLKEGLVYNKVRSQVGVPAWVFQDNDFMKAFIRGFFDTDGSVYRLKYGVQISLTNKSLPLLFSLQEMLHRLQYKPSQVSSGKVYITNRLEIVRFFKEVRPKNNKHVVRFGEFAANIKNKGY